MARYRIKRTTEKTYSAVGDALGNTLTGAADAVRNTAGGIVKGAGKALDTKVGGYVGAALGAKHLGGIIGNAIAGPAGGFIGKALGWAGGALLGSAAARGLGKGLQAGGEAIQA